MVGRWAHNKSWDPKHAAQKQQEQAKLAEEEAREAAKKAEEEALADFWSAFKDTTNVSPGHYRNWLGSHFVVERNDDNKISARRPDPSEAPIGPGQVWLPLYPKGTEGELYTWQCSQEEQSRYEPVILWAVGFDVVDRMWSHRHQQFVRTVQDRPVRLVKIRNNANENDGAKENSFETLVYDFLLEPCAFHLSRPCYVDIGRGWEFMYLMMQELQLEYLLPPAPEPLLDVGIQMPAEGFDFNFGDFQDEHFAAQTPSE